MLPSMKRLAVSTRDSIPPGLRSVRFRAGLCQWADLARFCQPSIRAHQRTSPVSPSAQRWIRRVGAPSTQRPCNGGQGNIRAHPPIEPARDQGPHCQGSVDSFTCEARRLQPRDDADAERAGARTRCHRAAAHRGCRRGDGRARQRRPVFHGARRCARPRSAVPPPGAGGGGGSRRRPELGANGCANGRPW